MALTKSNMLALGTQAEPFQLPDTSGRLTGLEDFKGAKAYLIIFMCNHCPYVQHIRPELALVTSEYLKRGVAVFGINSNDAENYPDDRPERMKIEREKFHYEFPYLYDATQAVARAYHAACTPEFYLFDSDQKLVYRGQFDDSRPGNGIPVTGKDVRDAMTAVLSGRTPSADQKASVGCNIKWK